MVVKRLRLLAADREMGRRVESLKETRQGSRRAGD
jgi:hypothetical protein